MTTRLRRFIFWLLLAFSPALAAAQGGITPGGGGRIGGSVTACGSDGQVLYNGSGSCAASAGHTFTTTAGVGIAPSSDFGGAVITTSGTNTVQVSTNSGTNQVIQQNTPPGGGGSADGWLFRSASAAFAAYTDDAYDLVLGNYNGAVHLVAGDSDFTYAYENLRLLPTGVTAVGPFSSYTGSGDIGFARASAGVLEINTGTAGTLAELSASTLNAGTGTNTPGTINISYPLVGTTTPVEVASSLALVNPTVATAITAAQNPPPIYYEVQVWDTADSMSKKYETMVEMNATLAGGVQWKWYYCEKCDDSNPTRFTDNGGPSMVLKSTGQLTILDSLLTSGDVRVGANKYLYGTNRAQVGFLADGALKVSNYATTSGATLDVNTADTLTVKDLAGTGAGKLQVGGLLISGVSPASSGTRYLCVSTTGAVSSSASACSGT